MTLLVDTSVWSLALRRDGPRAEPAVAALHEALLGAEAVVNTGLVLQELLQGFGGGGKAAASIIERFRALPMIQPERQDHIAAAEVRNTCRRSGIQIGSIDAPLIQLSGRHDMTLLSTDKDFAHAAGHVHFQLWRPAGAA